MAKCYSNTLRCGFDPGSKFCDEHGPAVKASKPRPAAARLTKPGDGLTVLPSKEARFAQVLRMASESWYRAGGSNPYDRPGMITSKLEKVDSWTQKLAEALNVDLSD